jgi:predicted DNA-binding protein (MmcQ/YjbR family)
MTAVDDDHDLDRLRAICLRFPEAEEHELQGRPLFCVEARRFALYNGTGSPPLPRWGDAGRSLHLVTAPDERPTLLQDPRFSPSPHHARLGWMAVRLDGDVDWAELAELLAAAYRQVAGRRLVEILDGGA